MVALTFRRLERTLLTLVTLREALSFWGVGTKQGAASRVWEAAPGAPGAGGYFSDITRFFSI
jgi:hypothetical protein